MRKIVVNSFDDLFPLTESCPPATAIRKDAFVVFNTSLITLPRYTVFRNLDNVWFFGKSGAAERAMFRGGIAIIKDCSNVTFSRIAFHPLRSANPAGPTTWERSWSSPRVVCSNPTKPCVGVSFYDCSVRLGTDEICNTPENKDTWPMYGAAYRPATVGLKYCRTVFGPSLRNYLPDRPEHNFGLAITCGDDFVVENCMGFGHHRRNGQWQGSGVVDGFLSIGGGTMFHGIHGQTKLDLMNCITIPTVNTTSKWPQTGKRTHPVQTVPGTPWLAPIKLYVSNVREMFLGPHAPYQKVDALNRINRNAVYSTTPMTPLQFVDLPNYPSYKNESGNLNPDKIGVGDTFDKIAISRAFDPWSPNIREESEMGLPSNVHIGDYPTWVVPDYTFNDLVQQL